MLRTFVFVFLALSLLIPAAALVATQSGRKITAIWAGLKFTAATSHDRKPRAERITHFLSEGDTRGRFGFGIACRFQ